MAERGQATSLFRGPVGQSKLYLRASKGLFSNTFLAKYDHPKKLTTTDLVLTHFVVMERDRRLTGTLRGQTDKPEAPAGFELNNPWKVGELDMAWLIGDTNRAIQLESRFS